MAICPFATQELIPPGANDPKIVPVGSVAHVAVSMARDLHGFFNGPSGGIESHFYILFDGTIKQYRDTDYEADAQAAGNSWMEGGVRVGLISYETQGMGDGTWTKQQLRSIKRLNRWLRRKHRRSFRWQLATAWNSGGLGYHAQFKEWNPNAHSCPGPARIAQFKAAIRPGTRYVFLKGFK